jgi:hypothetical protein
MKLLPRAGGIGIYGYRVYTLMSAGIAADACDLSLSTCTTIDDRPKNPRTSECVLKMRMATTYYFAVAAYGPLLGTLSSVFPISTLYAPTMPSVPRNLSVSPQIESGSPIARARQLYLRR